MTAAKSLKVRLSGSIIGQVDHTRRIVRGLGLRGVGSEVVVENTPSFRGMIKKIIHLVEVQEVAGEAKKPAAGAAKK